MVAEWAVLIVVGVLLGLYLYNCHILGMRAGSELTALKPHFAQDIRGRGRRGEDPDWLRYSEESDRQHEETSERIRNFATTALATGIGGTMFMLLWHLWFAPESTDAVRSLLDQMGFALLASVLGVACNLVILLWFLPKASNRFRAERGQLFGALHTISHENPPATPETQLRDTVSQRLEQFLENTATNFPGVIAGFRESVTSLSDVATAFESSAGRVESATGVLSSSMEELNSLPSNLSDELARARQEWTNEVKGDQEHYLKAFRETLAEEAEAVRKTLEQLREWQARSEQNEAQWREQRSEEEAGYRSALAEVVKSATGELGTGVRESLSGLEEWQARRTAAEERWREQRSKEQERLRKALQQVVSATGDVANEAGGLPRAFRKEMTRSSETLGKRFGHEARQQAADVIRATQQANKELRTHLEGHVRQLLNEMGDIVQQGLKPTEEGISRIGRNLETAGEELRRSIHEFAEHGEGFKASLQGAAGQIKDSSEQLAGVHEQTRTSIAAIQEEYRVMHRTLGESIEKTESLLKELTVAQGGRRRGGFLTRIFKLRRSDGSRRGAG